jgi:8-oxo-dGTP diphosphatase
MDTIKVTCGLIFDEGKIFICRRRPEKSLGGFWEFPGGKVELGETFEECLRRELLEELDMKVDVLDHFKTSCHSYDSFRIELISYLCKFKSAAYSMIDHDQHEWIDTKDLLNWKLAAADVPIAAALIDDIGWAPAHEL